MTTVTITQDIADIQGVSDNTAFMFRSPVARLSEDGDTFITTRQVRVKPVAGVLTVELEPGPCRVWWGDRQPINITIPETDSELWPLVAAGIASPPSTAAAALAAAVDQYLEDNPPVGGSWDSLTGKPAVIGAGGTQAAARTAIGAVSAADITAAVNAVLDGAPGALDTLNELAAALGDDANYAATVTAALAAKAPLASPTFTGTVSGVTKSMVGLGSVDNTADTAKPVSTAQQTALNKKVEVVTYSGSLGTTRPTADAVYWVDYPSTPTNAQAQDIVEGTAINTATETHAATSKATPVDADELPLVDSAASNGLKKLTWANLKATLATWLLTLTPASSWTNKALDDSTTTFTDTADATKKVKLDVNSSQATGTTKTMLLPSVDATLASTSLAENFFNKSLQDTTTAVYNTADATKKARLIVPSGQTTSTTRNHTLPAVDSTLLGSGAVVVADLAAAAVVTASETISANNNDTTIPTSAAVKAYADSVGGGGGSGVYPRHVNIPATVMPSANSGTLLLSYQASCFYNAQIQSGVAQNNYLEWDVVVDAGTYTLRHIGMKNLNSAITTISIDGGADLGTSIDMYNGTTVVNNVTDIPGIALTAGRHQIRFKAATKNASSTNYAQNIQAFSLTRTGA